MSQVIIVRKIKETRNPLIKQLELATVIEKSAMANPVAFFLAGVPKVSPGTETRVFYQSVSTENIKERGIEVGSDFKKVFGLPNAKLVVKETFKQRTWVNGDGTQGFQNPKINPQTGAVLQVDGKSIYRNVELSLDGSAEDEFIQHEVTTAVTPSESKQSIAGLATKLQATEDLKLPS